jgi:hypothetical protein
MSSLLQIGNTLSFVPFTLVEQFSSSMDWLVLLHSKVRLVKRRFLRFTRSCCIIDHAIGDNSQRRFALLVFTETRDEWQ